MKRYTRLFFLSLALLLLLSAFSSCELMEKIEYARADNEGKAKLLLNWANENAENATSYTANLAIEMKIPSDLQGEVTVRAKNDIAVSDINGTNETEVYKIHSEVIGKYDVSITTEETIQGFANGKMFAKYGQNALYTEMTVEEYRAHQESSNDNMSDDLLIHGTENCSYTLNEETGEIHCDHFSEEFTEQFFEVLELENIFTAYGIKVSEPHMQFDCVIGEDHQFGELKFLLEYKKFKMDNLLETKFPEYTPVIELSIDFSDWNETVPDVPDLDTFQEIQDLRVVDTLKKEISDLSSQKSGKHHYIYDYDLKQAGKSLLKVEERNLVEYTINENDELSLSVDARLSQKTQAAESVSDFTVVYKNEELTTIDNKTGTSSTEEYPENAAHALLTGQFNFLSYFDTKQLQSMTAEEVDGTSKYIFTFKHTDSYILDQLLENTFNQDTESTFTVTYKDGEIIRFDFKLKSVGKHMEQKVYYYYENQTMELQGE